MRDEEAETVERVPDLSPGSRGIAMSCVDIIGRIYQKEVRVVKNKRETKSWQTRMLVGPHDEYTTKDRTGALGRVVAEPTVPKFLQAAGLEE